MASSKLLAHSGLLTVITNTPVIEITPDYTTGDLVGGLQELKNAVKFAGGGGLIQSVTITDKAKQNINKDVFFFDTQPTNSTFTENGAIKFDDVDLLTLIGLAQITVYAALDDSSMGVSFDLAMPFVLPAGGTSLWVAIAERGTADYGAVDDLTLRVSIMAA